MEAIESFSAEFAGLVWSLPMVFFLFGAGLVFTILQGFPQFRFFKHAIDVVRGKYDKKEDEGEISHFQALCAALSATVGLGNIAGVAVAISVGGPGAVFWMWIAGLFGMATKFTSVSLSLMYREKGESGHVHGGPMYTIKHGLADVAKGPMAKVFGAMAAMYAFFTILSSFGAGNMFQANQMASVLSENAAIPVWASGGVFCFMAALVLIGGIERIGDVASAIVPVMITLYFLGALGILGANYSAIPSLLSMIVTDAFTGTAATGGFTGVVFSQVLIQGVRRAVFSNEAGMGSAAMAHSAAKSQPIQEGVVALLEPFIDTIVVCTITALVILITGTWSAGTGLQGSELTAHAFGTLYGDWGSWLVTATVVMFAFSTIISWSYYGEQGTVFLFGEKAIPYYRVVFLAFTFIGAIWKLGPVLNFSDAVFGLLAIPNIIANLLLTPKLRQEVKKYEEDFSLKKSSNKAVGTSKSTSRA